MNREDINTMTTFVRDKAPTAQEQKEREIIEFVEYSICFANYQTKERKYTKEQVDYFKSQLEEKSDWLFFLAYHDSDGITIFVDPAYDPSNTNHRLLRLPESIEDRLQLKHRLKKKAEIATKKSLQEYQRTLLIHKLLNGKQAVHFHVFAKRNGITRKAAEQVIQEVITNKEKYFSKAMDIFCTKFAGDTKQAKRAADLFFTKLKAVNFRSHPQKKINQKMVIPDNVIVFN